MLELAFSLPEPPARKLDRPEPRPHLPDPGPPLSPAIVQRPLQQSQRAALLQLLVLRQKGCLFTQLTIFMADEEKWAI